MSDFSFLATVKSHLQSKVAEQNIYLTPHTEIKYPCCVLEVDEINHNTSLGHDAAQTKIKFRTVCLDNDAGVKASFIQSREINRFLDGQVLTLPDGSRAVVRLMGSVVDISKNGQKKTVSHYYESLVRR
ncbi:hypothetical protein [Candidatus Odyssella thessalonicensis]|uniref:hypothetical protein n=1 Tax=Candidatus Odyssella thessalonicensis TaxID=84647 RepID=UPI000225C135|nr:hypothetical protein [Candidatus Odyssella thessalonicensis]